ncbi:hypothetical protein [Bradyrhizobium prioriisuperbiae]|uniref:hypothetical protein n=1 Tax=Bradyrhizobium prioriisuperbiae TaxID=2854389 RepID=UPI0028EF2990|nr:hypothetical protein [Bradyrhizobium prioritasuperba]
MQIALSEQIRDRPPGGGRRGDALVNGITRQRIVAHSLIVGDMERGRMAAPSPREQLVFKRFADAGKAGTDEKEVLEMIGRCKGIDQEDRVLIGDNLDDSDRFVRNSHPTLA